MGVEDCSKVMSVKMSEMLTNIAVSLVNNLATLE